MTIIGTKWAFRNKLDENGIISRNKVRLVAQGYNQQEGIDYDKTYAPVARLESIRILLAYACALDFKLFQMDVKSAFMNALSMRSTADGSKPKPKRNNHTSRSLPVSKSSYVTLNVVPLVDHYRNSSPFSDSKHFMCSTCHKCIFNANHDACITKFLKEVNSRAKIQSHKTKSSIKPVEKKSHTPKPVRQIFTGHRFSPNKSSTMYEKTSPRPDLRWKPTGRIFKTVGLRWILTGKLFNSCTSKADNESTHGSNIDISKIHECKQTLDLSAGTSINVQKKQSIDLNADGENLDKMNEKGDACIFVGYSTQSKDYMVYNKRTRVIVETIHVNFDEASNGIRSPETVTTSNEMDLLFSLMFDELLNGTTLVVSKCSAVHAANAQENTTPSTSTTVAADTPPLHIQITPETTNHPLEQVIGNPSQSTRIIRQLETDGEMCMFALTVSRTEPKNIKESMADSASKGYGQQEGIDFEESFAPVAQLEVVR
ncbi:retrovirus-related pol polyprotein from transposon TNT 1-94 [Tanacetum coccineum]